MKTKKRNNPKDHRKTTAGRRPVTTAKESPPSLAAGGKRKKEAERLVELLELMDEALFQSVLISMDAYEHNDVSLYRYLCTVNRTLDALYYRVERRKDEAAAAN